MNNSKPWYKSKTILFNAATAVLAMLGDFGDMGVLSPQTMLYINMAGNTVLRFMTNKSVGGSGPKS